MAGLKNKDANIWETIYKEVGYYIYVENVDKLAGWGKIRGSLPKEFRWDVQYAGKKHKKERAMREIVVGIRKWIEVEGACESTKKGIIETMVKVGEERWRLIGVYVNGNMGEKLIKLRERMEEEGGNIRTLIEGDFNVRTGI